MALFQDIRRNVQGLWDMLGDADQLGAGQFDALLPPLLALTQHESGRPAERAALAAGCRYEHMLFRLIYCTCC